jgi:hypothetical protein
MWKCAWDAAPDSGFFFQPLLVEFEDCRYAGGMKLRLLVEFDRETKRWSAVFPEIPGCASAGDTEKEAQVAHPRIVSTAG